MMKKHLENYSTFRLVLASLSYFRLSNAAILLGAAVGTAVLAGALLVGASLSGSLEAWVGRRLGAVDHALAAPFFFQDLLAERLAASSGFQRDFSRAEALLTLPGACANPASEDPAVTANIFGSKNIAGGSCRINELLARELSLTAGEALILRLSTGEAEAPIGSAREALSALRLTVKEIVPLESMEGSFSLYSSQRPVKNIWVSLSDLQKTLAAPGSANLLLVCARPGHADAADAKLLQSLLPGVCTVEDYGLHIRQDNGTDILESNTLFINERVEKALAELSVPHTDVLAYLANTIKDERTGRQIPYSMVAGLSGTAGILPASGTAGILPAPSNPTSGWPAERRPSAGKMPAFPEKARVPRINLNQWAADQLQAKPGDQITLEYFIRGADGLLSERSANLVLAETLPLNGPGADPSLVPEFKGLTDSAAMADWRPPHDFKFDFKRLRPADEEYWKLYRAAPKAFIALAEAQKLWGEPYGSLTSARFKAGGIWRNELAAKLPPEQMGLAWRPIRAEELAWAEAATDFGMLFTGFSFFLILSAAMLVALLMRLAVEQRARQLGLLAALGFSAQSVRRLLLLEGALLLVAGCALGAGLALGVAELMLLGLRTIWNEAVGTQFITLHVDASALLIGFAVSVALGLLAVWRGVGRLHRNAIASLLGGSVRFEPLTPRGRLFRWVIAAACLAAAGALTMLANAECLNKAGAFFGAGACFLCGSLAASSLWLNSDRHAARPLARWSSLAFALHNAGRNRTRSLLAMGLLAAAALITLVTGAMKETPAANAASTGGYNLICAAAVPLPYDLSTPEGRRLLGFGENSADLCRRVQWTGLNASAGEDASCRNLAQPNSPRLLGLPDKFISQGGFAFSAVLSKKDPAGVNLWEILHGQSAEKTIPAIADAATAEWILHKNLGEFVSVRDEFGAEWRLQLVGLLAESIFQSELLVSAENFKKLFPSRSGFNFFLLHSAPEDASALRALLRQQLADFGPSLESSRERLSAYARIANTYISAFQALGGLGLFLGSLGLLVVLARGIFERRGELALLLALGFTRRALVRLLLMENGGLLAGGLLLGALSGALAAAPAWLHNRGQVWSLLAACGLFGAAGAVILALLAFAGARLLRNLSAEALRRE
jgi:ABC-type lipoprotein release transport system permease subunit